MTGVTLHEVVFPELKRCGWGQIFDKGSIPGYAFNIRGYRGLGYASNPKTQILKPFKS